MTQSFAKPLNIWADPDDTRGRAIYRAQANALARRQLAWELNRVRIKRLSEEGQ